MPPPSTLSRFVGLTRCECEAIKSHKPVGFLRWHRHTTDGRQSRRGRHTYRRRADLLGRDFGSYLIPEELRELAHLRWDVENNGFKAANQTVVTKRIYSHNPHAQAVVLLILLTVCNLLPLVLKSDMLCARTQCYKG